MILNVYTNGTNSSNLRYTLDTHARLEIPQEPLYAYAEGSNSILSNGNTFLGYGVVPVMAEFGPSPVNQSDVRYKAQFAHNNLNNTASSYRTFKAPWNATPSAPLDLVVRSKGENGALDSCASGADMRGYVSWNGATDVTSYEIFTGSSAENLQSTGVSFKKAGFETEFVVPQGLKEYVQVAAFEGHKMVGKSNVVKS